MKLYRVGRLQGPLEKTVHGRWNTGTPRENCTEWTRETLRGNCAG